MLLFSTDGAGQDYVTCGQVPQVLSTPQLPGVYPTVDFGPGTNVTEAFAVQRLYAPRWEVASSHPWCLHPPGGRSSTRSTTLGGSVGT